MSKNSIIIDEAYNKLELHQRLAMNYVNVSVIHSNPDYQLQSFPYDLILKADGLEKGSAGFARNILLIGNGASYQFCGSVTEILEDLERDLKCSNELLDHKDLFNSDRLKSDSNLRDLLARRELYIREAKKYTGKSINMFAPVKSIKEEMLYFEGRLSVLIKVTGQREYILQKLRDKVNVKTLPSSFYEVVAHLFKHRFIDVIINFNFDELLDNAIEDELGPDTYLKVFNDFDIKNLQSVCDKNRLRMPIYVKPHGTVLQPSSMLFTKEQYIDITSGVKSFLKEILQGKVSQNNDNGIKKFNFILAGFALESIEFNEILFDQFTQESGNGITNVDFYIYDKKPIPIKDRINGLRQEYCLKEDSIQLEVHSIETTDTFDLSCAFHEIYKEIQAEFKDPFKPQNLCRHKLLLKFFPEPQRSTDVLRENNLDKYHLDKYLFYLENRILFHLIFDLIKYNGFFQTSTAMDSRAGKYYKLLLKKKREDDKSEVYADNLQTLLNRFLGDCFSGQKLLERKTDVSFIFTKLQNSNTKDEAIRIITERFYERCFQTNNKTKRQHKDDSIKEILSIFKDVYDKSLSELNPVYLDAKLGRFLHFGRDQILTTNLAFTYKLYEYAIAKKEEWNVLLFADNTSQPIYNFQSKFESNELENLSGKHIILSYVRNKIHPSKTISINEEISNLLGNKFLPIEIEPENSRHHMALFLKYKNGCNVNVESLYQELINMQIEDLHSLELIYGIYFFKPFSKNKINPVYFDKFNSDYKYNNRQNLGEMLWLFRHQLSKNPIDIMV